MGSGMVAGMTHSIKLYGEPHLKAKIWHWEERTERDDYGMTFPTGKTGTVRGITEMEALDRLRADEPTIGRIRWTQIEYPMNRNARMAKGNDE
jgi:hypothetical protein